MFIKVFYLAQGNEMKRDIKGVSPVLATNKVLKAA
jgi:hypothetical protein